VRSLRATLITLAGVRVRLSHDQLAVTSVIYTITYMQVRSTNTVHCMGAVHTQGVRERVAQALPAPTLTPLDPLEGDLSSRSISLNSLRYS
jgi:hypothetical protein